MATNDDPEAEPPGEPAATRGADGPGGTGGTDGGGPGSQGGTADLDQKTHDSLLSRWTALLVDARDGRQEPDPLPYGRNLLRRWSEPQRRYHTPAHLLDVLNRVDELAPHVPGADVDAVLLAAWFHDAVYRPDRSENEERSAALAERALREAEVPQARTDEVARLVRLTATHDPAPGDADGELLCDADLAVLAGSPDEYARYAAAVREEYGFLPDGAFLKGRAGVLRQLLGLPHLFRTPYARERWEHVARRNLQTELELLVKGD